MTGSRIRSDFWVSAHLRLCAGAFLDAVLRRRGAAEAGAIFVSVDRLDGTGDLYGPAPQSVAGDAEGGRLFAPVFARRPVVEIEAKMAREVSFDPDLWWIAIDHRDGRTLLPLAPAAG